jgi:4-hydroxy-3-polyprenylbenzoate decarboxylase
MLLYGFVRNQNAQLVKSLTNDIYIPRDVDVVIEGFVDPQASEIEGPFGDHTGYYTLPEPFPVMEVETITMKKNPVFQATVVGKPPLEDKYMGWATERIFLPMLKPMAPDLIDYNMPENGVFHNLILAKMAVHYPGHAQQFMHAFWGVGQMSFVKHAIFVGKDAPELEDHFALTEHILDRLTPEKILISHGVVDHLDHSSPQQFVGGKLGVDATGNKAEEGVHAPLADAELLSKMQTLAPEITGVRQYFTHVRTPICVATINKTRSVQAILPTLESLTEHVKLLILVDTDGNDLDNPYMLIWRVVNNIDAGRDVALHPFITVDGTHKGTVDGYKREWPGDTLCTPEVLKSLQKRNLIEIDDAFIQRWGLV